MGCWLHILQSILLEALFVEDLLGFSKLFSFEMLKFASKQLMESARLPPLLSKERKKKAPTGCRAPAIFKKQLTAVHDSALLGLSLSTESIYKTSLDFPNFYTSIPCYDRTPKRLRTWSYSTYCLAFFDSDFGLLSVCSAVSELFLSDQGRAESELWLCVVSKYVCITKD